MLAASGVVKGLLCPGLSVSKVKSSTVLSIPLISLMNHHLKTFLFSNIILQNMNHQTLLDFASKQDLYTIKCIRQN